MQFSNIECVFLLKICGNTVKLPLLSPPHGLRKNGLNSGGRSYW